ncbi:hypothetical protein B1H10_05180, partial [candidate division KSB1 bacterium 4484_188]
GYAVDVGLLYFTRFNGMRLGMSISNFGTDMQLDGKDLVHSFDQDPDHLGNNPNISSKLRTVGWPLPLFYRVGASMDILRMGNSSLMMLSDAVIPSDNSTDTEEGLTAGLGIKYFVPGLGKVSFDYAYNDYGLLEQIHVLGLGFSF